MNVYLVEDEPLFVGMLSLLVQEAGHQVMGTSASAEAAWGILQQTSADLVLIDIHLAGDMNGLDLAEKLYAHAKLPIIFITSLQEEHFFERARQVAPFAYLTKPFDHNTLRRTISLALHKANATPLQPAVPKISDSLFVNNRGKLEKVAISNLLYMEADGRYTYLILSTGRRLAIRTPIGELQQRLPANRFFRSHRSYVIQLHYLESIDFKEMQLLVAGHYIPLSKSRKGPLEELLDRW